MAFLGAAHAQPSPVKDTLEQRLAACAGCHGPRGEGMKAAIRITLNGGFPPSTQGNPRPYGMPPFAHVLSDGDVAAVVTYIRGAWGNAAGAVSSLEVASARGVPLD